MKNNYVFECRVCHNKDKSDDSYEIIFDPCYLMSTDRNLFDKSTYCPLNGRRDAEFKLIGVNVGINLFPGEKL